MEKQKQYCNIIFQSQTLHDVLILIEFHLSKIPILLNVTSSFQTLDLGLYLKQNSTTHEIWALPLV